VFRYDVDGAFFRRCQIAEGVFGVGEAASEADGEEGWVVVYYLRVGEGCEVGRFACEEILAVQSRRHRQEMTMRLA